MSLNSTDQPRLIDLSTELILDRYPMYGWAAYHLGAPASITPQWAPDGRWVAYLKRVHGSTQVWRASVDGARTSQITRAKVDVDDFRLVGDGRTIVYAARPDLADNEVAIDQEGLRGWHYNARAFPIRGARPQTPDAVRRYVAVDVNTGIERAASDAEAAAFVPPRSIFANNTAYAVGPKGQEAWAEVSDTSLVPPDYQLVVDGAETGRLICPTHVCKPDGTTSIWWTADGEVVRFSRREGWANSLTGIYEWRLGGTAPKRVYLTSDLLIGCKSIGSDLLCLRERSSEPRHFVRLKLDNGIEEKLYDPNPDFSSRTLGRVERLNWRNEFGISFYGDLVYPVNYVSGRSFPLVVVQYRTKGFLRGGIGDEVPIQVLAEKGYFALIADNLTYEDIVGRHRSAEARSAAFNHNFTGRRNILSAIEVAVRSLIDRGLVSKEKIGISGLSDGSSTVQFAAINSKLFAAGSVSGGCWSPFQDAVLGPMIAQSYHKLGWPRLVDKNPEFWANISTIDQLQQVQFPMLFQMADNEYLGVIACHTALNQVGVPSDLYIFPDEEHIKWQPAHRLAVYRRNLAWFDFWLRGQFPSDPVEREEATRWLEMKEKWHAAKEGDTKE